MGLLDDCKELFELLKRSSWTMILLAVCIAISTFVPIASLANDLIQWKGFLLDGLNFYRKYIAAPIIEGAIPLGMSFSQVELDTVLAISFQYFGAARVAALRFPKGWRKASYIVSNVLSWVVFVAIFGFNDEEVGWYQPLVFAGLFVWYGLYLARHYGPAVRPVYFGPVTFALLAVLALGALNVAFLV